ncbi:TonB-dependent copper receptor [Marinobacterium sp. YM272]|uniref:TonB-dependent copper receptor n=1 Tax=Marinobacterium sp. YM272 TaxID=3421654 RepID=UPI003D7FE4F9
MRSARRGFWILAVYGVINTPLWADDQPMLIEVIKPLPVSAAESELNLNQPLAPAADGGEVLRDLTGVSGSRMGGRGIDPVIRGQQQNRLNVILDGAYIYGACPNRMDPPTTYSAAESYDRVVVLKGNHSVIYGPGGSGGTVLFERERPQFDAKGYRGKVSAGYAGNGESSTLVADLAAGSDRGYVRFIGDKADAGNYEDGAGDEVRSSYETESNALMLGARVADRTWLEGSYEQVREEDVLFPGAGMDSPYSDADTWRLKLDHQPQGSSIQRIRAEVYRADIDHLMDNYSLRPAGMMRMAAPTSSDTLGGRLLIDSYIGGHQLQWGVDHQQNNRKGVRQMVMPSGMRMDVSDLWPDVTIEQTGLFAEVKHYLLADSWLKAGGRLDHVTADAKRTPADDDASENNLSGFLTWNQRLDDRFSLQSTLSRSVRTADATERYIDAGSWQGNPDLDPEIHQQMELMLSADAGRFSGSVSGYLDRVDDFILRKNNRYSNVGAQLYGIDLELAWQLDANWRLSNGVSWVRGTNRDDDTNLSQIPPLTATLALDYQRDAFHAGGDWLLVSQQSDVCLAGSDCGGQDLQQTPGYGVVNLNAGYDITANLSVDAGIDNLFDKRYSDHLNREDLLGNSVQVSEPGRNLWVRMSARF